MTTRYPPKRIELRPARRPDEGYSHELHFTTPGDNCTNVERVNREDLDQLHELTAPPELHFEVVVDGTGRMLYSGVQGVPQLPPGRYAAVAHVRVVSQAEQEQASRAE